MLRHGLFLLLSCLLLGTGPVRAGEPLRVLVVDNAPPMAFRDSSGALTGFAVEIARALCAEMHADCAFEVTTFRDLADALAEGRADLGAAGMLDTPLRRTKMIYTQPVFRSVTVWLARKGVPPGHAKARVAVVGGSAQEAYVRSRGWETVPVRTNGDLAQPMLEGRAQAIVAPMVNAIELQKNPAFRKLDTTPSVLRDPAIGGDAYFGISPHRPELKEPLDAALARIKRNGVYDRINSRFLPFRVS